MATLKELVAARLKRKVGGRSLATGGSSSVGRVGGSIVSAKKRLQFARPRPPNGGPSPETIRYAPMNRPRIHRGKIRQPDGFYGGRTSDEYFYDDEDRLI